jgi:hypothetical protein
MIGVTRLFIGAQSLAVALLAATFAFAQESGTDPAIDPELPLINSYAPATSGEPLAQAVAGFGEITLAAQLTADGAELNRGLIWRIFSPKSGPDGKLPLVASAAGGSSVFQLEPGSYLVHASFGRAGATKRITVGRESKYESVVLDAGGLKLNAVLVGGKRIQPSFLKFSIYESKTDAKGERALIIPDVSPNTVVRLNSGNYQVVSTYGSVNAVVRSDIRVEAGKLVEATIEHHAAELTMKLVREPGGEAIADTQWSITADTGDPVREVVGAYASMVLAEGEYTIIAKNRDRLYQRNFKVESGKSQDVEVVASEDAANQADEAD